MASMHKLEPIARHRVAIVGQVADAVTGRALRDAEVTIIEAPPEFVAKVIIQATLRSLPKDVVKDVESAWHQMGDPNTDWATRLAAAQAILDHLEAIHFDHFDRPDRTRTADDGGFYFMDLPAIELSDTIYALKVRLPGAGTRYGKQAHVDVPVVRDDAGNVKSMRVAAILLHPTTLQGWIVDPDGEPVPLAEVRVKGSGERTFTDAYEDTKGNPGDDTKGHYRLTGLEAGLRGIRVSAQGFKTVDIDDVVLAWGKTEFLDIKLEI